MYFQHLYIVYGRLSVKKINNFIKYAAPLNRINYHIYSAKAPQWIYLTHIYKTFYFNPHWNLSYSYHHCFMIIFYYYCADLFINRNIFILYAY